MKIALCGSHSTGKTTLLNALRVLPKFKNYTVIEEVARKLIETKYTEYPNLSEERRVSFQNEILGKQFNLEVYFEDNFISDRSIYDILAYSQDLPKQHYDFLEESYLDVIDYDLLFYLPIEFPLEKDGIRPENLEYQAEIDRRIKNLIFWEQHVKLTGTVEERVAKVLETVKNYK